MDWWLPPKSVAFSKKLRRALKTWVATGCHLPLCPMQLNNELFLKGRHKQYISITVHRTFPLVLNNYWKWVLPFLPSHFQCFTNTWKFYSSVPKWYSYRRHEVTNTWSGSQVLGGGVRTKCARLGWAGNSTELGNKENHWALILPGDEKDLTGRWPSSQTWAGVT